MKRKILLFSCFYHFLQIVHTSCYNTNMDYKNYIWDLGGTLLDNYESSSHAFAATLWQLAERVILHTEAYDALKISTAFAVEKFASDIPGFLEAYKKLEAEVLEKPILFDGAVEVLSVLTASGQQNFMISHRNNQVLSILKAAKIEQYFTEVVTSDNGFKRKPAPDSINYLIKKYQLNPLETVMIGDRALDIEAGCAAGIATIFFDAKLTSDKATHHIQSLREIIQD